ncbi:galactosyltransferase-related protein [Embleya sp. NBC_00896]|uniref:galactosyltransferase-related protein n=1 Tax=Embleya sp. NBC_00896 TaxID=2975961 RepID=UPI00386A9A59|nr:galactosyltransferase-related protein [Embleya sp. NBC_00896]
MSVVVPLYGDHEARRAFAAVASAWLAQSVCCEVVVATAGDLALTVPPDLDDDRRVRVVRAPAASTAAGLLRNVAAERARASLLYLTDADVAPLGRDFLDRALELAAGGALAQPWMYRFVGGARALDERSVVDVVPVGEPPFCFVREEPDGVLRGFPDERLVWDPPPIGAPVGATVTPRVLPPPRARAPYGPRSRLWRAPYHLGAMLLDHATFDAVGGYCLGYLGWGGEDDDLLAKVAARTRLRRGRQLDPSLNCLHFEHPTPYDGTPQQAANESLLAARIAAGPDAMIEQDLAAHAGPGGAPHG